jgi:hypothetical protein
MVVYEIGFLTPEFIKRGIKNYNVSRVIYCRLGTAQKNE